MRNYYWESEKTVSAKVYVQDPSHKEAATRMPRGHCTLTPDDTGRILDRLAGLEQVIPPEAVRQALQATGRLNPRSC